MEDRDEFEMKFGKWIEDSQMFINEISQSDLFELIEKENDKSKKDILTKFLKLSFIIKSYPENTIKLANYLKKDN